MVKLLRRTSLQLSLHCGSITLLVQQIHNTSATRNSQKVCLALNGFLTIFKKIPTNLSNDLGQRFSTAVTWRPFYWGLKYF